MHDPTLPPFTVTPAAIDAVERLGGSVRLDLADGGCCGTTYEFTLSGPRTPGDLRFGCPGAWLVVSRAALAVVTGATLDHADALRPPRFRVVHNPNTPTTCPCHRSFGTPWQGRRQPCCRADPPVPWGDETTGLAGPSSDEPLDRPGRRCRPS